MASNKYKLRRLLKRTDLRNTELKYTVEDVRGVLNSKGISNSSKADLSGRDLSKFLVVKPGGFVFNHRIHDKLGLGFNTTDQTFIFTNDYVAFEIDEQAKDLILPDYLYMWFCRSEFDRYVLFNSYGSATLFFNWDNMCDLEIDLPSLHIQQKYVAIYKAMLANQQSYERGLEDLKLVCDGCIEDLRRKMPCEKIGQYLVESDRRNTIGLSVDSVRGLSTGKEMIPTKADMNGVGLDSYKVVGPRQIAYVPDTSRRGEKVSLGFNNTNEEFLVSSIYVVFRTNHGFLLPEYLMMFYMRSEFDRYARFNSWGSARETFDWNEMCNIEIPIPDIKIQQAIVDVYNVYIKRKEINEQLKTQIKDICPILIRGSLEGGTQ